MIGKSAPLLIGIAFAALVAGCDREPKAPTGQVVATLDGKDITIHELNAESSLAQAGPDVPRKTIEAEALKRIIERKVLAEVAEERGLEKNPNFILQQRRMEEVLLAQALQADVSAKVPKTTREAAEKYIEEHPDQFAQRKIYIIDQIAFLRPPTVALLGLQNAKTMADVQTILQDAKIEFRRQEAAIDTLRVDPRLATEIGKILARNPSEVFMFADQPRGAPAPIMFVNQVTQTRVEPFTGEKAIELAQTLLQRQAVQTKLQTDFKAFMDAKKDKIVYAEGYGPPAAAAASKTIPAGPGRPSGGHAREPGYSSGRHPARCFYGTRDATGRLT